MTDTPTTFLVLDGSGAQLHLNASQTAANTITPWSQPQIGGAEVDTTNPLPMADFAVSYTDRSGTITTGGTAQVLMAANPRRRGWIVQNTSGANLFVNETGSAATQGNPSWLLVPNQTLPIGQFNAPPSNAISIIGPNTSQSFIAREW